ncbi:hypothetical protein ACOMHN_030494 [Nucella lapillus]
MLKTVCLFFLAALCVKDSLAIFFPLHASCKIDWAWEVQCSQVQSILVDQMEKWKSDNCSGTEKCLYTLKSRTESQVTATHETPVKHYVDDLTFTFTPSASSCKVKGHSTSETWYAVLDYGTNYCNLHNLITGSGLDNKSGYKETTSNSVCTQFSTADCSKY